MPLLTRPASHLAERGTAALPALVAPVAEAVLRVDLPGLDRVRRDEVVGFIGRRCRTLPSFVRLGVFVIAAGYRAVLGLPGGARVVRLLGARGLRPPMDAWSHHPYPLRRPSDRTPPNRAYVDLYNLDTLFRALDATYLRGKPVWLTEFGFATRRTSQYPFFVTPAEQARFMSDAFRRMRATPRVKVFVWYLLQDHPDWASGVLDVAGNRKPSYRVFRSQAVRTR